LRASRLADSESGNSPAKKRLFFPYDFSTRKQSRSFEGLVYFAPACLIFRHRLRNIAALCNVVNDDRLPACIQKKLVYSVKQLRGKVTIVTVRHLLFVIC